jgi:ABC-type transport system involved in multi-copper enzyme maturation permease subunit
MRRAMEKQKIYIIIIHLFNTLVAISFGYLGSIIFDGSFLGLLFSVNYWLFWFVVFLFIQSEIIQEEKTNGKVKC